MKEIAIITEKKFPIGSFAVSIINIRWFHPGYWKKIWIKKLTDLTESERKEEILPPVWFS